MASNIDHVVAQGGTITRRSRRGSERPRCAVAISRLALGGRPPGSRVGGQPGTLSSCGRSSSCSMRVARSAPSRCANTWRSGVRGRRAMGECAGIGSRRWAGRWADHTVQEIRHIHHLAMSPVWAVDPHRDAGDGESPGQFRAHDIRPFAAGTTPPTWPLVPSMLTGWVDDIRSFRRAGDPDKPLPEILGGWHAVSSGFIPSWTATAGPAGWFSI